MHTEHGSVRAMMDSQGAEAHITHGMDTKTCESFKRTQPYAEDTVSSCLVWIDHVPGIHNPADILKKQLGTMGDFCDFCDFCDFFTGNRASGRLIPDSSVNTTCRAWLSPP